jgi:hypothetical protein
MTAGIWSLSGCGGSCPVEVYLDDQYIGVNDQDIVRTRRNHDDEQMT